MWTEEEDEILINAQIQMGNKWSYISKLLPGRSENAVKNRYNSIASRNGVRKKRLGNFVNRSVAARNNLLRLQSLPKPHAPADSPYAELLEKASQAISRRSQRPRVAEPLVPPVDLAEPPSLSDLSLPDPFVGGMSGGMSGGMNSGMNGGINGGINGMTSGTMGYSMGQSMGQSIGTSLGTSLGTSIDPSIHPSIDSSIHPSIDPSIDPSLKPFTTPLGTPLAPSQRNSFLMEGQFSFGAVDTSEMELPAQTHVPPPLPPRSAQEEEASLQQIDSFLLAGVVLWGKPHLEHPGGHRRPADRGAARVRGVTR